MYTPERLLHILRLFFPNEPVPRTSRISCFFFLFACAITVWTSRCRYADSIRICDYALPRYFGGFFGRAGNGPAKCRSGKGRSGGGGHSKRFLVNMATFRYSSGGNAAWKCVASQWVNEYSMGMVSWSGTTGDLKTPRITGPASCASASQQMP